MGEGRENFFLSFFLRNNLEFFFVCVKNLEKKIGSFFSFSSDFLAQMMTSGEGEGDRQK